MSVGSERAGTAEGGAPLRIEVLEPYDAVSHRLHWDGLREHSRHRIGLHTLPARRWKVRMRTASFHFAEQFAARAAAGETPPDLWVCSEYLSVAEFVPLLPRGWRDVPIVVDFHENQLTYPLQAGEVRDLHFGFSHLHAGAVADRIVFHSRFHRDELLAALPGLLKPVTDIDLRALPSMLAERAVVLPIGIAASTRAPRLDPVPVPTVAWSHRWEYDKGPEILVDVVERLLAEGERFRLRLLGGRFRAGREPLGRLAALLGEDLIDEGFLPAVEDYRRALLESDITLSTARHEFFGISTAESLRLGLLPILPDDLAYPELLPREARRAPFLYPREDPSHETAVRTATEALREGLAIVREGGEAEVRGRLLAATAQLGWEAVAPRYDALFEEVVGEARNGAHAEAQTRGLSPGRDPDPRTGATRGAPRAP